MKADVKRSPQGAEKEALEWATEFFRNCKYELKRRNKLETLMSVLDPFLDCYDSPLSKHRTLAEKELASVVEEARKGDAGALELTCNFAGVLIANNKPLPEDLRDFIFEFLCEPSFYLTHRKPGRRSIDQVRRNIRIWAATEHIIRTWNFKATRGREQKMRASATSIVREALETGAGECLGEDAVVDAWKACRSLDDLDLDGVLTSRRREIS
jgi:hypothetical protein